MATPWQDIGGVLCVVCLLKQNNSLLVAHPSERSRGARAEGDLLRFVHPVDQSPGTRVTEKDKPAVD